MENFELRPADLPSESSLVHDQAPIFGLDSNPAIQVEGVSHFFGLGENRKQILFDIDLDIYPGELVIMTGPSGSGKSTLVSLIGALRTVQQGNLTVGEKKLDELGSTDLVQYRQDIGFIFQMHNLFESLTATENVKMALQLKRHSKSEKNKKAQDILSQLGLGERLNYKPESLSGGQRQRVAVARALVNRPKIVLADEPTAALDKESGKTVVEMLKELCEAENSTVILITHDNRILDYADRLINMVDGRIVSNTLMEEEIELIKFLKKTKAFSNLSANELTLVARKLKKQKFKSGDVIIRQGDPGENYYMVRSGSVDVKIDDGTKWEKVASLGQGEAFGEASLLTGDPCNATVYANVATFFYVLDKESFKEAIEQSPTLEEELRGIFFQRQ